ncbi:MAG: FliM/FliN family flagellar motor switch protein [Mariprofundaceae bacterium]
MAEQENINHGEPNAEQTVNIDAILDIPLDISVEMGRISLPLSTISRFVKGAVVEFNKELDAGVDVLANGRVFAKGEIVSADGKLGVRIVDIVSEGNRIRALG